MPFCTLPTWLLTFFFLCSCYSWLRGLCSTLLQLVLSISITVCFFKTIPWFVVFIPSTFTRDMKPSLTVSTVSFTLRSSGPEATSFGSNRTGLVSLIGPVLPLHFNWVVLDVRMTKSIFGLLRVYNFSSRAACMAENNWSDTLLSTFWKVAFTDRLNQFFNYNAPIPNNRMLQPVIRNQERHHYRWSLLINWVKSHSYLNPTTLCNFCSISSSQTRSIPISFNILFIVFCWNNFSSVSFHKIDTSAPVSHSTVH